MKTLHTYLLLVHEWGVRIRRKIVLLRCITQQPNNIANRERFSQQWQANVHSRCPCQQQLAAAAKHTLARLR